MKAVAYIRVSTQDQSLERQYEDIRKFSFEKGIKLVEIFEDKISGFKTKTDDREGFKKMEKFIEDNKDIQHILVLEISRLGRKNNDIQNVVEKYIEKGINIHIKDLNISTLEDSGERSIASEMMISLLGVIASNESRLLSSRISSGKMSRARRNLAFGGKIIGYKKGEDGKPIIDEKEAPLIERIFELASKDLGMRNISTIIESEFGKKIAGGTLSGIIRNTFHKGERRYNDLILEVPAIVSKELWEKANESINSRKKFKSRTNIHTNIVQGKIKCICGNTMHQKVIPKARIDIFICKDTNCKNSINRPWLFRMVKKVVERHAKKTKEKEVREKFKLLISSNKAKINLSLKELKKLEKKRKRARDLYLESEFTKVEYLEIKAEIEAEFSKRQKGIRTLENSVKSSEMALKNNINHFSDNLELFKSEIKDILKHVIIDRDWVLINIFGWRVYELKKPNSIKLGWEARKPESERYKNEELPLKKGISDEDLELMINDYLRS
ncbi:recombinase family protein [Tenacibaculum sp. SDUM215027]|uniref:recombinase family protein n=1 Tax=Tenacibaculum sp. SDUM215027 TaxID=3422596 RepID=UPI003D31CABD